MIIQKLKGKIRTLYKILKFVYSRYTWSAIIRDFLFLVSTAAELYSITVLGKFIDETTTLLLNWKEFEIMEYFGTESFFYLCITLILWIVAMICTQARSYFYDLIFERVWEDTQEMVMSKVSGSNLEDVEKENYQDMLTFIPSFSINRMIVAYENFSVILKNVILFVSASVILYEVMGWSVFLLVLFVLPETIVTHLRRRDIRRYQDNEVGKLKFINHVQNIALTISNFLELRVNNIYSYLNRRFKTEYDEYLKGYLKVDSNFYQDKAIFSIIGQTLKFGYIIYLLSIAVVKGLSFGTFKALYDYVGVVYSSMYEILNSLSIISINLGYAERFFDLVEYKGFGDNHHGDIHLGVGTPTIELKDLDFHYPDDPSTTVLKKIDIKIEPGEKVAFFGGDGSGKTTLVKILTGLYQIQSGKYLLNGQNVKDLDRGELKDKYSVIFQDFINYHFSLKENVVISGKRKNTDNDLYDEVCKITGVDGFKKDIHLDDSTILGKTFPSGKDLSPGYWQRLSIARMLYRNRQIFLMDEPFTYINEISAKEILLKMFDFIGRERTIIYTTRNISHLELFDKIYYFEKGKIIESGSFKELIKMKGRFYNNIKDGNEK